MSWWTKVVDFITGTEKVVVRSRNKKGRYVADDESTPDVNEAYTTKRVKKTKKAGSKRFDKLETMLWAVYPFIVGAVVLTKFI